VGKDRPERYWQENEIRNPPPPVVVPDGLPEMVIMVPAVTFEPAVAVHVSPAVAVAGAQEIIAGVPAVQVDELVLGVTGHSA
jgi:hypothetical protein